MELATFQTNSKIVQSHRHQGHGLKGSSGAQFHSHFGYDPIAERLKNISKILLAQKGILGRYFDPHIPYLLINLLNPAQFVDGLPSFTNEGSWHNID